jgi:hypothetical protein
VDVAMPSVASVGAQQSALPAVRRRHTVKVETIDQASGGGEYSPGGVRLF